MEDDEVDISLGDLICKVKAKQSDLNGERDMGRIVTEKIP